MDDAETQLADVDVNGTPVPPAPVSAPAVPASGAPAPTPSAPAASSSSAAPAVATPTPNPDSTGLTVDGGKRPNTTSDQDALPRSRRARRQQGRDVKQWTLSVQKARGIRPMCG
eukprot:5210704-Alexandrium_andersonii.AAC.1